MERYYDGEQGLYTVHITASKPALMAKRVPGRAPERLETEDFEPITADDNDVAIGIAKVTIKDRCGKILVFRERGTT
jgi:hypothetical protein